MKEKIKKLLYVAGVTVRHTVGKTSKGMLQIVNDSDLERDCTNMHKHMAQHLVEKTREIATGSW